MRIRNVVMAAIAATALTLAPVDRAYAAEESPDCTRSYLLCLNEASQEEGLLWRTLMETECGIGYYGCLRKKALGL